MHEIWKQHWPAGLEGASIRLPTKPITHFLKEHARRTPQKAALVFYGREISFAELDEADERFAGWLVERGLRPGERVAIFPEARAARARCVGADQPVRGSWLRNH